MNTELINEALKKVGNPSVLVGIISRRVRQLNAGGGALSHPLIEDYVQLGAADIALREIIEEKIGWEILEEDEQESAGHTSRRKRK